MVRQIDCGSYHEYKTPCGVTKGTLKAAALHEDHCRKCQDSLEFGDYYEGDDSDE